MSRGNRRIAALDAFDTDVLQHDIRDARIVVHIDSVACVQLVRQIIGIRILDVHTLDVDLTGSAATGNIDAVTRRVRIGAGERQVYLPSNDLHVMAAGNRQTTDQRSGRWQVQPVVRV